MQQSRFDRWFVVAVVIAFVLAVFAATRLATVRKKPRIRPSWSEPSRTVPRPSPVPPPGPQPEPNPR